MYYDLHLAKPAFVLLAQLFDVSPTTTYSWLRPASEAVIEETIKEIEIGERRRWILKALDSHTGQIYGLGFG